MSPAERIKNQFIARAMKRAEEGRYPVIEPTSEDNRKDLQWWLRALDSKAFLMSVNGSAAWLFPHYELKLVPLGKRVLIEIGGETIVDSNKCFEFHETAHSPQIFIPPTEVQFQYLFKTDTVTFCPFKDLAHYYGVRVRDHEIADQPKSSRLAREGTGGGQEGSSGVRSQRFSQSRPGAGGGGWRR